MSGYDHAQREVMDVGVDWLTCTSHGTKRYKLASIAAERLIAEERDRGNRVRKTTVEGYAGFECGQVFAGALAGTMLTRMSGALAANNYREVLGNSTNVSRLDLQATIRYSPHVPHLAERVERDVRRKLAGSKSRLDVQLRRSLQKGNTCYIGSRVSEYYARVYDKYRESRCEDFAGCWRWELELKKKAAQATATKLLEVNSDSDLIHGVLVSKFRSYGARRLWATPGRLYSSMRQPRRPEAEAIRMWLAAQVSGRVAWMIERGYTREVIDALGLSEVVTINAAQPTKEG